MKKLTLLQLMAVIILTFTSGCSIHGDNDPNSVKIWISPWDKLTKDEYNRYLVEPVAKTYPNMHISLLVKPITEKTLNEFKGKGIVPDLIVTTSPYLLELKPLGILNNNIEPLFADAGLDMKRLDPNAVESVRIAGGESYLTGIPFIRQFHAMYYNKDIFDKFQVPYPKDGMTWQDAAEVASRVTKKEGEIQYRGLEPDNIEIPASALRVSYIDTQSNQAIVMNKTWKTVFATLKRIYDIPGNKGKTEINEAYSQFFEKKQLAMLGGGNWLHGIGELKNPPNWDMVSYPTFKEAPSTGPQFDGHVIVIPEQSRHKPEAVQMIGTLLSDEVQLDMSKHGRVSILADSRMKEAFGSEVPLLKQKNVQAAFKTTPAKPNVPAVNDHEAGVIMDNAMRRAIMTGEDVDQSLQEANDDINLFLYEKY